MKKKAIRFDFFYFYLDILLKMLLIIIIPLYLIDSYLQTAFKQTVNVTFVFDKKPF